MKEDKNIFAQGKDNFWKPLAVAILGIAMAIAISYFAWLHNKDFRNKDIALAQYHMMATAKATAISIQEFINNAQADAYAIANDTLTQKGLSENDITSVIEQEIKETYNAHKKDIDTIYLLNSKGVILHRHPFWKDGKDRRGNSYADKPGVSHVLKYHEAYISNVFSTESGKFTISVLSPVHYNNKFVGIARLLTNISTISERFVKPIKVGKKGYAQLLDNRGILLYHPESEYIGEKITATMKEKFPDFDWSELEAILERMTIGEEGFGAYHSVLRTEKEYSGRIKKLTSFAPIRFGKQLWSFALNMSYDEIAGPINKNAITTYGFAGILILLFSAGGLAFYKTQKKKAVFEAIAESAEALRESEERFRIAFENAATGIALMANDGYFMKVNQALCRILGYSEEEFLGKTWVEITEPDDLNGCYDWLKRVKTGEQSAHEKRFIHKLGHPVWVMVSTSLVRNPQGRTRYYISLFQDITSRKQAEEALRESEEKYRLLVKNLTSVVYKGYKDWSIEFFDEKIELITGYSADEFNSKRVKWIDIIAEKDIETAKEIFIQALKTDKSYVREYRLKSKTGSIHWIEERGQIVCDNSGEIEYVSGTFFDKTETKKLEAQLQQTQKLESVGILAGGIAHDFNNLLSIIMGNISMAKEDVKPEYGISEFLDEAENASLLARDLTKQLITFSKGGAPVKELSYISNLIEKATNFALSGSTVGCQFNMPADLWPVEIDQGQIRHVINNVVINAVQAMPKGGTIEVCAENFMIGSDKDHEELSLQDGKYVKLSIQDHGTGISDKDLPMIFDPY